MGLGVLDMGAKRLWKTLCRLDPIRCIASIGSRCPNVSKRRSVFVCPYFLGVCYVLDNTRRYMVFSWASVSCCISNFPL